MTAQSWLEEQYVDGTHMAWHMSAMTPEVGTAIEEGWLIPTGVVVDLGCGLGHEVAHLAEHGMRAIGIDISHAALRLGRAANAAVQFVRGDTRRLPLASGSVSTLLDRGCFHYLQPEDRSSYVDEASRVLVPGGRLLLRACLPHEWMEQDLNENVLEELFAGWHLDLMRRESIPVDTGTLGGIVARLRRPAT